jgi:hypothetical protein
MQMRLKIFGNGSKQFLHQPQKLYFMLSLEKYIRQASKSHTGLYKPVQARTGPYRHLINLIIAFYNRKGQKYVG